MKKTTLFVSMFVALFLIAVWSAGSPALAIGDEQTAQTSQEKQEKVDKKSGMGMQGDMPACCKRKMSGKAKTDATMESMDEQASQAAKIAVTENGFEPSTITLKPNVPAKLTFVRQTDKTCAKAIAIPEYKIKRDLPLNEPVVVEFTPSQTGEFTFTCGMNMLKGKLVVAEKGKERSM
jgi:plastocyanin